MTLRNDTLKAFMGTVKPRVRESAWAWGERELNFSMDDLYETEIKGPYDASFMPHWKEVVECLDSPRVKEVWVLKNSRAGCSENVPLLKIRQHVAEKPIPILYVSGDQKGVETFMEKRIKRGMNLSKKTRSKFKKARVTEHLIYFDDMTLTVTWPSNAMGMKSEGYALVVLDEFSIYKNYSKAMYEKRTGNWAHSHIIGLSSIDPNVRRKPEKDPIIIEYNRGDQREWMCKDPVTGNPFTFRLGKKDTVYGLKFDVESKDRDTGVWDLNNLDAHYVTPDGTRIDEKDRMNIVRAGWWQPTNPKAENGVRSYKCTGFMSPFKDGSFELLAKRFLRCVNSGDGHAFKVFFAEELAEYYKEVEDDPIDDVLINRTEEYSFGEKFLDNPNIAKAYPHAAPMNIVTIDVQETHVWFLARQWTASGGGHSGLIDCGRCETLEEALNRAKGLGPSWIYIDNTYFKRQQEVYKLCGNVPGLIPVISSPGLSVPFRKNLYNLDTGGRGGEGRLIQTYTIRADTFRDILDDLMRGKAQQKWHIPRGVPMSYFQQIRAMAKNGGVWEKVGADEHFFDCEMLQVFAAIRHNLLTWWDKFAEPDPEEEESEDDEEKS